MAAHGVPQQKRGRTPPSGDLTLRQRLVLGWGKLRRAYFSAFQRDYIRRSHARRAGECARCGACCRLMFTCPYLESPDEGSSCTCHDTRWRNCRVFPIDERDLADRDLVMGGTPCGYRFEQ